MSINGDELNQLSEAVSELTGQYRLEDEGIAANVEAYREAAIKASNAIIKQISLLAARIKKFDPRMAELATLIETRELCTLVRALDHPALGAVVLGHTQVLVLSRTIDAVSELLLAQELENLSVDDLSGTLSLLKKGLLGDLVVKNFARKPEKLSVEVLREKISDLVSQSSSLAAEIFPGQNLKNLSDDNLSKMIPLLIKRQREISGISSTQWMLRKIVSYLECNTAFWARPTLEGLADFTSCLIEALRVDYFFPEKSPVTQRVAKHIAKWVVQHDFLEKFDDQALANLVGKIIGSSWAGRDGLNPMDHITLHLLSQRDLKKYEPYLVWEVAGYFSQCNLAKFEPQQLVDSILGLSQIDTKFERQQLADSLDKVRQVITKFEPQQSADLLNEPSLLVENFIYRDVFRITDHLAAYLSRHNLADFTPEQIGKLVHGFNQLGEKLNQPDYEDAIEIADHLSRCSLAELTSEQADKLAHELEQVVIKLNQPGATDPTPPTYDDLKNFTSQQLASLLINSIARYILQRDGEKVRAKHLADVIIGFSKVVGEPDCKEALSAMDYAAASLFSQLNLPRCEPQQIVDLVNSLSQIGKIPGCEHLLVGAIGAHIAKQFLECNLEKFKPQQLADLVKGFSQELEWPDYKRVLDAVEHVARHIKGTSNRDLANFEPQQLAELVNGLSRVVTKFNSKPVFGAIVHIAKHISQRDLTAFEPRQLVNLVSGFSQAGVKAGFKKVRGAIVHLAKHILQQDLAGFEPRQRVDLAQGFIQADPRANCKAILKAIDHITQRNSQCNGIDFKNTGFCKKLTEDQINPIKGVGTQINRTSAPQSALAQAVVSAPCANTQRGSQSAEERANIALANLYVSPL